MVILIFVLRPCLLSTTALKSAVYIKQCHIGCAFFLISWLKPVLLNMKTLVRIHSPPQLYKLAQCGSGLKPFEHLVKLCRAYFVCNERLISNFISFLLCLIFPGSFIRYEVLRFGAYGILSLSLYSLPRELLKSKSLYAKCW